MKSSTEKKNILIKYKSIYKQSEMFSLFLSSGRTHRRVPNRATPDTSLWNKPLPNGSSSPPQLPGHLIPKQAAIRLRTKWTKFAIKLNLLSWCSEKSCQIEFLPWDFSGMRSRWGQSYSLSIKFHAVQFIYIYTKMCLDIWGCREKRVSVKVNYRVAGKDCSRANFRG